MPVKHEQPTNQAPLYHTEVAHQPLAIHAQVPNHYLPLIAVDGILHHPIAEASTNAHRILTDLIANTRLTAVQRYAIQAARVEHDTIIAELRALAAYNHFHNDQPLSLSKSATTTEAK
jgi:hypothetical protein